MGCNGNINLKLYNTVNNKVNEESHNTCKKREKARRTVPNLRILSKIVLYAANTNVFGFQSRHILQGISNRKVLSSLRILSITTISTQRHTEANANFFTKATNKANKRK